MPIIVIVLNMCIHLLAFFLGSVRKKIIFFILFIKQDNDFFFNYTLLCVYIPTRIKLLNVKYLGLLMNAKLLKKLKSDHYYPHVYSTY